MSKKVSLFIYTFNNFLKKPYQAQADISRYDSNGVIRGKESMPIGMDPFSIDELTELGEGNVIDSKKFPELYEYVDENYTSHKGSTNFSRDKRE